MATLKYLVCGVLFLFITFVTAEHLNKRLIEPNSIVDDFAAALSDYLSIADSTSGKILEIISTYVFYW